MSQDDLAALEVRPAGQDADSSWFTPGWPCDLIHKRRTESLPDSLEPLRGQLPSAELAEIPPALRSQLPINYRRIESGFQHAGEDQQDAALQPDPTGERFRLGGPDLDEMGLWSKFVSNRN